MTPVWIDHFRYRSDRLSGYLESNEVWSHAFAIGELDCGALVRRDEILDLFAALPCAPVVEHREALDFLRTHRLGGQGLGWVDVHLLASAHRAELPLRTRDRRPERAAGAVLSRSRTACAALPRQRQSQAPLDVIGYRESGRMRWKCAGKPELCQRKLRGMVRRQQLTEERKFLTVKARFRSRPRHDYQQAHQQGADHDSAAGASGIGSERGRRIALPDRGQTRHSVAAEAGYACG